MKKILLRILMLVSVLSMVLGIVYYMSETHINDAVSSLVARDYLNYDDYIDNPEKYVTDERPLEEVLAIGNLVYHNYNKQSAIEEIYINKSVLDDLSELEIQNLEKKVKDLTVDRYDYYFTWGFFEYAKSNAGAYVVVIMYEIIRNAMVKRGNTKETKK
ncbi:MAG: hypothetical protein RBR71_07265 [Gudongella sp.]|nr:hypothetical protein [Gudongella sp.]